MSHHQPEPNKSSETDDGLFASSSPVYVSPSSPVGSSPPSPSFFSVDKSRQEREWRKSLAILEKEIEAMQATLAIKSREASELRRRIGITKFDELREGVLHGYQSLKESEPVVKTNAALKSVGDFASRKLSDIRNSTAFKSVGEKVDEAYTSVKRKLLPTKSEDETNKAQENTASAPPLEEKEDVKDTDKKIIL